MNRKKYRRYCVTVLVSLLATYFLVFEMQHFSYLTLLLAVLLCASLKKKMSHVVRKQKSVFSEHKLVKDHYHIDAQATS